MRARSLMAVLVLAALLFSVLALGGIYKTGEPREREVGSGGGAELTITTLRETTQGSTQTTTRETIVIYSAPERWPEARRYALFEVIDVPGNVSLSAVYFEQVPGLDAVYYEPLPDGSVVTHLNVTYVPRQNETVYLATLAYVIRGDPRERGIDVPETLCIRRHESPETLANCFIISGLASDLLLGTITRALDFGLKILSGEELRLDLIDEDCRRYTSVDRVVVGVMNITSGGSWYRAYREYALRGLGENVVGRGSYAYILPKDAGPQYLYLYVSKTGLLSILDSEKERPVALIRVGRDPDPAQVRSYRLTSVVSCSCGGRRLMSPGSFRQ
jgi:hypothetical protein